MEMYFISLAQGVSLVISFDLCCFGFEYRLLENSRVGLDSSGEWDVDGLDGEWDCGMSDGIASVIPPVHSKSRHARRRIYWTYVHAIKGVPGTASLCSSTLTPRFARHFLTCTHSSLRSSFRVTHARHSPRSARRRLANQQSKSNKPQDPTP